MARNLQAKLSPSDTIRLYDINRDATQRLAQEMKASAGGGAIVQIAEGVADAAKNADIVVTVLPEPMHVKSVYSSILESGLSPRPKTRIFMDCSTIDVTSSKAVAASVAEADVHFVDAPMSGGVVGATAGALTFMLGSPACLVDRIQPILLRMGKRVLHCGEQGAGLSAKLANNYLLAIQNIAAAEALNLGIRCGLDPKVVTGVINVSTGKCWSTEINNPVKGVIETSPANRDYNGGFGLGLMTKDLKLAMLAAKEVGARMALADKARDIYETAQQDERCQGKDMSVIYRWLGGKE